MMIREVVPQKKISYLYIYTINRSGAPGHLAINRVPVSLCGRSIVAQQDAETLRICHSATRPVRFCHLYCLKSPYIKFSEGLYNQSCVMMCLI
jgi:hypothetical protein